MPSVSPLFADDHQVTDPVEPLQHPAARAEAAPPPPTGHYRPCDVEVEAILGQLDPGQVAAILFSSTTEETSGSELKEASQEWSSDEYHSTNPLSGPEENFRHSHWKTRRSRIFELLNKPGIASPNRLSNFAHCGAVAHAEFSPSTLRYRVSGQYCHDRFCEPCMRARSGRIAGVLRERAKGLHCRFLTLTQLHTHEPLRVQIDRLRADFATFRHSKAWKEHVDGGAVTMEVKLSDSGQWHPHLHMILAGSFWDTDEISAAWKRVTGTSWIVKIKDCGTDPEQTGIAVRYVCGYITKPAKAGSIWDNEERFIEMMGALKGRRLVDLLGNWRGWIKEDEDAFVNPKDWRRIGTVDELWALARAGEAWAIAVLHQLNNRIYVSPGIEEASLFSG